MSKYATRRIGKTSLEVSELGLGCAAMAGNHTAVSDADIEGAIEAGLASGISYVDTAPFYGYGRSEHFVGSVESTYYCCMILANFSTERHSTIRCLSMP